MNKLLIASLTMFLFASIANAQKGILGFTPLYSGYTQDQYLCMRNSENGFKYQILLKNKSGVMIVTIKNQLLTFLKYFQQNHDVLKGNYLWISIEQNQAKNCQWHTDFTINCGILDEIMTQVRRSAVGVDTFGIMSTKDDWNALFGNKCNKYSSFLLHYKNYDNKPNFSDWNEQKFGGWTKPTMKTYSKGKYECYIDSDLTVY